MNPYRFVCFALLVTSIGACRPAGSDPAGPPPSTSPTDPTASPGPMACTEIGCADGLTIAVQPNDRWPAGAYTFTFELDAETTTCTGSLPLPACETQALSCDKPGVLIGESGCALPKSEHGFSDIQIATGPAQLKVSIKRESEVLISKEYSPEYQQVQPNGPGCEPTCRQASVDLHLPIR